MDQESVIQGNQKINFSDYFTHDEFSKFFSDFFSEFFVAYNLDSLYYEDREQAIEQLKQIMDSREIPFEKSTVVVCEFLDQREKILARINSIDKDDIEEMIMLLFYAVHSFETFINQHIYFELETKGFTQKELKRVQWLKTDDKLGWLLKLICGKEYTSNNKWSLLKNFIETRNFYIHYSPNTSETYEKHNVKLSKESFTSFMDNAYDCYLFLNECLCKENKERLQRVQKLRDFMRNEFKTRSHEGWD